MNLGKNQNITKAAKDSIKKYCLENGFTRDDVAEDLGIVRGTLDNKLKPSDVKISLTGEEILKITEITDDNSILKAMCGERGLNVYDPIEVMPDGGDMMHELLVGTLEIDIQTGKLSELVKEAISDHTIDEKEAIKLTKALRELRAVERKIELMLEEHTKDEE